MRTGILVLITVLVACASTAQVITKVARKGVKPIIVNKNNKSISNYSIQQFAGRWQEVYRTDRNTNATVSFNDTLFYTFSGNTVSSRDGVNMSLKGEAAIDPGNVLVAAADVFTIKSLSPSQVVLDDGENYIHTLIKKKIFWHETLPQNAANVETYTTPISINLNSIKGKWRVYRRESKPGSWGNGETLIRSITLNELKDNNSATGEIMFYRTEKLETLPATFTIISDKIKVETDKNSWEFNIYKAGSNELVFGNSLIMYYAKPLL